MKKYFEILILLVVSVQLSWAKIHPAAGTTSAQFLKLGIGGRAMGMGQSFVAVADDGTAPEWNPAGTSNIIYKQITAMHHIHFQDITQDYVGYVQPGDIWSWAFTARGLFYPNDIERRSGLGENIPEEPLTQYTDTFGGNDMAVTGNISRMFGEYLHAGANLKFIRQKIDVETGSSFALDFGLLSMLPQTWEKPWRNITWGAAVQNIGPGIKFIDESYNLPLNLKSGIAYKPFEEKLLIAFDYNHSIDNYPYFSVGVEWELVEQFFLRSGYRYKAYGNDLGDLSGISAGVGFKFIKDSSIDYAFLPQGDLGNTHRMSITIGFGKPKKIDYKKIYIPQKEPTPKLIFKDAQMKVFPKKMALRRVYAAIEALPVQPCMIYSMFCDIEYPAGKQCLAQMSFADEVSFDDAIRKQLPENAKVYGMVRLQHNLDCVVVKNVVVQVIISKEWLTMNNVKPDEMRIIDSDGSLYPISIVEETKDSFLISTRLNKLPSYLIITGQ